MVGENVKEASHVWAERMVEDGGLLWTRESKADGGVALVGVVGCRSSVHSLMHPARAGSLG